MRSRFAFSRTCVLLKKSGKPADVKEYKQVYLPYEDKPTKAELDRERRKFAHCPFVSRNGSKKMLPVKDVPENMFTYGKEGMSMPIAIFKDQPDPVIGPEWTYPGIYENKIACAHPYMEITELFQKEKHTPMDVSDEEIIDADNAKRTKGKAPKFATSEAAKRRQSAEEGAEDYFDSSKGFNSPFERELLDARVADRLERIRIRIGMLKLAHSNRYLKQRAAVKEAGPAGGTKAPVAKSPDSAPDVAATNTAAKAAKPGKKG